MATPLVRGRVKIKTQDFWFCASDCFSFHTSHRNSWWEKKCGLVLYLFLHEKELLNYTQTYSRQNHPLSLPKDSFSQLPTNIYSMSSMPQGLSIPWIIAWEDWKIDLYPHGAFVVSQMVSFPDPLSQYWWKRSLCKSQWFPTAFPLGPPVACDIVWLPFWGASELWPQWGRL